MENIRLNFDVDMQAFRDANNQQKPKALAGLFKYFQDKIYADAPECAGSGAAQRAACIESRQRFNAAGGYELLRPMLEGGSAPAYFEAVKIVAQSTINSQENKAGVRAAQLVPLLGRYLSVEAVGGSLTAGDFQGVAPVKLLLENISALANSSSKSVENKIEYSRLGYVAQITALLPERHDRLTRKVMSALESFTSQPSDRVVPEIHENCAAIARTPGAMDELAAHAARSYGSQDQQYSAKKATTILGRVEGVVQPALDAGGALAPEAAPAELNTMLFSGSIRTYETVRMVRHPAPHGCTSPRLKVLPVFRPRR